MLHKVRQVNHKSVQVYTERLYALANDAVMKKDKALVESQLEGLFNGGLYHDNLCMKVMRKSKNISGCSTVCIGRRKFVKEISLQVK